jgi:hypothetical protein
LPPPLPPQNDAYSFAHVKQAMWAAKHLTTQPLDYISPYKLDIQFLFLVLCFCIRIKFLHPNNQLFHPDSELYEWNSL